jgi:hypothetical protein
MDLKQFAMNVAQAVRWRPLAEVQPLARHWQRVDYKKKYDIFICGGSEHFRMLRALLPKLYPFGRLHLASITLTDSQLRELRPYYDHLHKPQHDPDGYLNFNLFCIRDLHRHAQAPFFIKLDADAALQDDWIDWVERGVAEHPEAVLLGIKEGVAKINFELSGPLVRQKLGSDICITDGRKVIGGFCVGQTAFFQQHHRFMQIIHELCYCFEDGRRHRPSPHPEEWHEADGADHSAFQLAGDYRNLQVIGNEDTLRSLVVHALGAADRLLVLDSQEVIRVPHGPGFGHPRNWT